MGDKQGRTALHWSIYNGNEETVALLLAANFALNPRNVSQNTTSL
jgi:ankyrin repeat protein